MLQIKLPEPFRELRFQAQLKDCVIFMLLFQFYGERDYFVCICKGSEFQPKYECSSLKLLLWLLFVSTSAQPSHEWELMYDSKGTGMGFIGVIRGGLCWVQEKSVPTCRRENMVHTEKSSSGFDHMLPIKST